MAKSTQICNGCIWLQHESWPRGAGVMRCMKEIWPGQKRVVHYSDQDRSAEVRRPAWCSNKENEGETDNEQSKNNQDSEGSEQTAGRMGGAEGAAGGAGGPYRLPNHRGKNRKKNGRRV